MTENKKRSQKLSVNFVTTCLHNYLMVFARKAKVNKIYEIQQYVRYNNFEETLDQVFPSESINSKKIEKLIMNTLFEYISTNHATMMNASIFLEHFEVKNMEMNKVLKNMVNANFNDKEFLSWVEENVIDSSLEFHFKDFDQVDYQFNIDRRIEKLTSVKDMEKRVFGPKDDQIFDMNSSSVKNRGNDTEDLPDNWFEGGTDISNMNPNKFFEWFYNLKQRLREMTEQGKDTIFMRVKMKIKLQEYKKILQNKGIDVNLDQLMDY